MNKYYQVHFIVLIAILGLSSSARLLPTLTLESDLKSYTNFNKSKSVEDNGHDTVAKHGSLKVNGNKIVDKYGKAIQLRGMSLSWSQYTPRFWNAEDVEWLVDDWKITLLRAAMGVDRGGYDTNPDAEKAKVITVVDACIRLGIYVIIDWHIGPEPPQQNIAEGFWRQMATKYKNVPNVIFEIFNEPGPFWNEIKPYHERMVQIIRNEVGANNLMVLGTPNWSQDVDIVAKDRVQGDNLAYTLHFYSVVHKQPLRDKANIALEQGLPIFITEWGPCDIDTNDYNEAKIWLNWAKDNMISTVNWGVYSKEDACAVLQPSAHGKGHWLDHDLTEDGKWVRDYIITGHPFWIILFVRKAF